MQIVYCESGHSRSSATKREIQIKAMSRLEKEKQVATYRLDGLSSSNAI